MLLNRSSTEATDQGLGRGGMGCQSGTYHAIARPRLTTPTRHRRLKRPSATARATDGVKEVGIPPVPSN